MTSMKHWWSSKNYAQQWADIWLGSAAFSWVFLSGTRGQIAVVGGVLGAQIWRAADWMTARNDGSQEVPDA